MKKILTGNKKIITALLGAGLLISVAMVVKQYTVLPGHLRTSFSLEAADQGLTSFYTYVKGQVVEIKSEEQRDLGDGVSQRTQILLVKVLTGRDAEKEVEVTYQDIPNAPAAQRLTPGDAIVLGLFETPLESTYVVVDRYRLPSVGIALVVFVAIVLLFGRWRGLTSIVGLLFSIAVIIFGIAPNILLGKDPHIVAFTGAVIIVLMSLFLAHGFRRRTVLAVVATLITLGIAEALAVLSVHLVTIFGTGSADALYLQAGLFGAINLRGLLLASILIGALGVLDDVTTTQIASVEEISSANTSLSRYELYKRGASIGKEHIASLVNTLVLAYVSTSLPLILLVLANTSQPLWTLLNSESVVEEIVRTLVGSTALVLAVPISTSLAALVFSKRNDAPSPESKGDSFG